MKVAIALFLGLLIGVFIDNIYISKYNTINATCTLLNTAVEKNLINPESIEELGRLTKVKLGDSRAAKAFELSKDKLSSASKASNCSQFIVGMNK
ncbi:hypothetical protein [Pantoea ananatis]|uniref:hypothetical protein n=1 Tax=Pantoea ananas TaxID=553 RepID=UPI0023608F55|nr:hypothetical protein [Pantoea ananatis]